MDQRIKSLQRGVALAGAALALPLAQLPIYGALVIPMVLAQVLVARASDRAH